MCFLWHHFREVKSLQAEPQLQVLSKRTCSLYETKICPFVFPFIWKHIKWPKCYHNYARIVHGSEITATEITETGRKTWRRHVWTREEKHKDGKYKCYNWIWNQIEFLFSDALNYWVVSVQIQGPFYTKHLPKDGCVEHIIVAQWSSLYLGCSHENTKVVKSNQIYF